MRVITIQHRILQKSYFVQTFIFMVELHSHARQVYLKTLQSACFQIPHTARAWEGWLGRCFNYIGMVRMH